MFFGENIDRYWEDILRDLDALLAIPSVCGPEEPGKPFGPEPARALSFLLGRAEELGLRTHNAGNYAGDACLGEGPACADVMTHLDVVPAGPGWHSDPFRPERRGNLLFARGTADDKGAAVAALYALRALKDAGIRGNRRIRAVFGCGEETGSDDLDVYYREQGYPEMGFTPDCAYGICNCEKGILRLRFSAAQPKDSLLVSFQAGTAVNAVPAAAAAVVEKELRAESGGSLEALPDGRNRITMQGTAAHGAEPEKGVNAAAGLAVLLERSAPGRCGPLVAFLAEMIGTDYAGKTLGIACSDAPSGALTLNLGIVRIDETHCEASVDIRYPATTEETEIVRKIREAAGDKISVEILNHMPPLYVPADRPLIRILTDAYAAAEGVPCALYSTGGGTYARHARSAAVAFGPIFPGEPPRMPHGPDEHIDLDMFRRHARICLEAMYRMFTEPAER